MRELKDYAAYLDAWNRRDEAAVLSLVSERIVYRDHALHITMEGHEAIRQFVRGCDDVAKDFAFHPVAFFTNGTDFAAQWELSGTATGSVRLPNTGKRFKVMGATLGTLDSDGRILTNEDFWHRQDMLVQAGAV